MAYDAAIARDDVAQINITPLVDVMLVLLVIFMVSAPILSAPIPLHLPQAGPGEPQPAAAIDLRIDAAGQVFWNGAATPTSALEAMMSAETARARTTQPLLRIDASGESDYGVVAKVLAAATNADLQRIAFVQR